MGTPTSSLPDPGSRRPPKRGKKTGRVIYRPFFRHWKTGRIIRRPGGGLFRFEI